jgi:hypothetical protein
MMRAIVGVHAPNTPPPVGGFTGDYKSVDPFHLRYGMVGDKWLAIQLNPDRTVRGMFVEDKEGRRTPIDPASLGDA